MRIGVLSDIHSNVIAFKACIDYLESMKCDEYLLLGDYISDTPYTRETLNLLYDFINNHECHVLRGNREEYMLGQYELLHSNSFDAIKKDSWKYNSASGNLLFAYEQLCEADFEFMANLPITFRYEKEGYPAITCCHGSPSNSRELLQLDGANTKEWLDAIDTDYMLCAHTHYPGELVYKNKHYFNTGCIGIAINDNGFAQCMYLDAVLREELYSENSSFLKEDSGEGQTTKEYVWKPTFLKIPYDNMQVVKDIIERGMLQKGHWFVNSNIQILTTGIDRAAKLVELACKLSSDAGESQKWPNIKEEYFATAANELDIPDWL